VNTYLNGSLVTLSNGPSGFQVTATGESVNPTVVELVIWINVNAEEAYPTNTYVFGTDPLIENTAEGFFERNFDTTGMAGSVITYEWSGDPDGTVNPVCQAVVRNQFLVN
jgi:hypothetical protein